MGLDISVYTNVKLVQECTDEIECLWEFSEGLEDECPDTNITVLIANPHFPKHFETDGIYTYEDSENIYSRAYSAWSRTRNELAKAAGYDKITQEECNKYSFNYNDAKHLPYQYKSWTTSGGILHELLYFSDCEGTIGNEYCKKIYKDLKSLDVNLFSHVEDVDVYNKLLNGFKMAAESNGVVQFN